MEQTAVVVEVRIVQVTHHYDNCVTGHIVVVLVVAACWHVRIDKEEGECLVVVKSGEVVAAPHGGEERVELWLLLLESDLGDNSLVDAERCLFVADVSLAKAAQIDSIDYSLHGHTAEVILLVDTYC